MHSHQVQNYRSCTNCLLTLQTARSHELVVVPDPAVLHVLCILLDSAGKRSAQAAAVMGRTLRNSCSVLMHAQDFGKVNCSLYARTRRRDLPARLQEVWVRANSREDGAVISACF